MKSKVLGEGNFTTGFVVNAIAKSSSRKVLRDKLCIFAWFLDAYDADIKYFKGRVKSRVFKKILHKWKKKRKSSATLDALKNVLIALDCENIADDLDKGLNLVRVRKPNAGVLGHSDVHAKHSSAATKMSNERRRHNLEESVAGEFLPNGSSNAQEKISVDSEIVLGCGGMGKVYKGVLLPSKYPVAVKIISDITRDKAKNVIREIGHLKVCQFHPNVVQYYGHTDQLNKTHIALERCDKNLQDWIGNNFLLDHVLSFRCFDIIHQMALGLQHLHNLPNPIVHRDLKPENILIKFYGRSFSIKLADFGISKSISEDKIYYTSQTGYGSQRWMSPEILQLMFEKETKVQVTTKADVFSLGCLFYYVLTHGEHPFPFAELQLEKASYRPIVNAERFKDAPSYQWIVDLIKTMISFDAHERPSVDTAITQL